jgi:hypothetical protein
MSHYSGPYGPQASGPADEPSTAEVAREEAVGVGQHAREAGGQVAQTAVDQARQVAAETGRQARDLLGEAQGQMRDQASTQQQKAAQQLHSVADELGQMAANGGRSGVATEFAGQVASRLHGAASWLEQREPADLLEEVRNFARRRPGTFLIGAAVAGLAAGRLTRSLTASRQTQSAQGKQDVWPEAGSGVPAATPAIPAEAAGTFYPAADPVEPAGPLYPADPAGGAGAGYPAATEPIDPTPPEYPAEPMHPAEPGYPYPPEPGIAPSDEGPRLP